MSEPIKIVVTAETAQAAAALQQFVQQTSSGLRILVPAAGAGASSLTQAREAAMLTHESFRSLSATAMLLGGTRFPELSMGVMGATQGLRALRTAAMITGVGMSELLIPIAAIGAVVAAGALVWRQFSAGEAETAKQTKELEESLGKIPAVLEKIQTLMKAGALGPGTAGEFADYLTGNKKLYKNSSGSLVQQSTETMEEPVYSMPGGAGYSSAAFPVQTGTRNVQRALPEASLAETQAWVEKQLSGEAGLNDSRIAAIAKLKDEEEKARLETLNGLEKEKAEIHDRYQKQRDEIAETIKAAGPLLTPEKSAAAGAALGNLDAAEQQTIITAEKKAQAESDKLNLEVQKAYDDFLRDELAVEKSIDDQIKKQREEAEKILVLRQEIARAAIEAKLKGISENPLLSDSQKAAQSAPLYQQNMGANAVQIAGLESQYNATTDLTAQLGIRKKINDLMVQQAELQSKLNAAVGNDSFAYQFKTAVVQLQNMNNLAKESAQLFGNVMNTAISSVSSNITKVIEGTQTWRQALLKIADTIIEDIIQGIIQMGVRWVVTQTMMAVVGESLSAASVGVAAGEAATLDLLWYTPAILSAIATAGVTAEAAPALVDAAMFGFAEGGYTGAGAKDDVAGLVHRGEYVFPQSAVDRLGVGTLSAIAGGAAPSGSSVVQGHKVNLHFYDERPHPKDFLATSAGENMIVNIARKNRLKIGVGT